MDKHGNHPNYSTDSFYSELYYREKADEQPFRKNMTTFDNSSLSTFPFICGYANAAVVACEGAWCTAGGVT